MIPSGPAYDVLAVFAGIVLLGCMLGLLWSLWKWGVDQRDGWRDTEHPGATEHEPALAKREALVIARSPLLAHVDTTWAEQVGRLADEVTGRLTAAEQQIYGAGRHRMYGARDPLLDALLTKTQLLFVDALELAGETPPETFGPRESELALVRTEQSWEQAALIDVEAVAK